MAPEQAWQLLQDFTAKEARGLAQPLLDSSEKRRRLRDALLVRHRPGSLDCLQGWAAWEWLCGHRGGEALVRLPCLAR